MKYNAELYIDELHRNLSNAISSINLICALLEAEFGYKCSHMQYGPGLEIFPRKPLYEDKPRKFMKLELVE